MNRRSRADDLKTVGVIICVAALGFFAIPLIPVPAYDELTKLSGTITRVRDHTQGKSSPHLRVRLDTLPSGEWVSILYDSASRDAVRRIARGDVLEVLAEHDSLGRDIWFAWEVRSGSGTFLAYGDFIQRRQRQSRRMRIAGLICGILGAGLVLGTTLATRAKRAA
jgi:hypothetical protein